MPKLTKKKAVNPLSKPSSTSSSTLHTTRTSTISKRDKQSTKKGNWQHRLKSVYTTTALQTAKSLHLAQNGVAADLTSITAAITELDEEPMIMDTSETTTKSQKPVKQSSRIKANMDEINRFQKILGHERFKGNPMATIQMHLKNTLKSA
ncbi:hypothetical protein BC829DRAFT_447017 [Chytridium lagenaria]|nr:hypothetical protein BC829DRAFT_447017 [Chytridium lagenaria]